MRYRHRLALEFIGRWGGIWLCGHNLDGRNQTGLRPQVNPAGDFYRRIERGQTPIAKPSGFC
jgi:hypothetical protein